MQDLLDEVKRDIKEERVMRLWAKYSSIFFGLMILVVIIVAGYVYYAGKEQKRLEVLGSKLHKFNELTLKSLDKIDQLYGDLEDASYKSSSAFKLVKANKLLEQGEIKKSQEILLGIISNESSPIEIKEIAGITYATNFTNDKSMEIIENIAAGEGPFKISAQELKAYSLFDKSKYEDALKIFKEIQENKNTPRNMQSRVTEAISYIESKFVITPKEEVKEETEAGAELSNKALEKKVEEKMKENSKQLQGKQDESEQEAKDLVSKVSNEKEDIKKESKEENSDEK